MKKDKNNLPKKEMTIWDIIFFMVLIVLIFEVVIPYIKSLM